MQEFSLPTYQDLNQLDAYTSRQKELLEIIRLFHWRGWSPATSTNYSFRNPGPYAHSISISSSGVDKSTFGPEHLMALDLEAQVLPGYAHLKPSAETLLHTMLYQNPTIGAVLHTHSLESALLSQIHPGQSLIRVHGYEIQKGLRGTKTHESEVGIPIFENSQDMRALETQIRPYLEENPDTWGFVLAQHGLYAWGENLAEAKRHVEVWEYLFACINRLAK